MNTSMPTTSNDLAALVTGGSSSGKTSQLKGMFADLAQSRSVSAETGSDSSSHSASDFETMLDTPATVTTGSDGLGASSSSASGKSAGESTVKLLDQRRSVLSVELSVVSAATLQIKGIVSNLTQAVVTSLCPGISGVEAQQAETVDTLAASDGQNGHSTVASARQVANGPKSSSPLGRALQAVGLLSTAKTENTSTDETGSEPTESESMPAAENEPVAILTPPNTVGVSAMDQANQALIAVALLNAGNVLDPISSELGLGVTDSVDTAANESEATPSVLPQADAGVPVSDNAVVANLGNSSISTIAGQGAAATAQAPAKGLRSHALLHRSSGQYFARTSTLLPSVENHQCAVGSLAGVTAEKTAATPINAEQRRELIDTVAALIAPLMSALTKVVPSSVPATSEGTPDNTKASNGDEGKTLGASVTIKLAGRPVITLELPFSAALLSAANASTRESAQISSDENAAGSADQFTPAPAVPIDSMVQVKVNGAASVRALLQQPALDAASSDESTLDFRVQLKGLIEAAWAKNDALSDSSAGEVILNSVKAVIQADMSGFSPEIRRLGFAVTNDFDPAPMNRGKYDQLFAAPVEPSQAPAINSDRVITPTGSLPPTLGTSGETPIVTVELPKQTSLPAIKQDVPASPVEVKIEMPGFGSLTAEIVASQPASVPQEKKTNGRFGRAEKTAGDFKSAGAGEKEGKTLSEKTFLSAAGLGLKAKSNEAGTDVAISGDNMPAPFTSRRLTVDPLELPPRFNARGELLQGLNESKNFAAPAESAESSTPAPVLAHRAVETIMNVVDAQRNGSANASSVNLHFKFGGDDLAVRVQMRGGEVLTQFLTDSAELRSALSSEWQIMAGQGGAVGLRLLEPTIMPASAGVSTGFGSASQGQGHTQQQQQQSLQQHAQTAAAFTELRGLRRGVPITSPGKETAPRVSIMQPTSHHLTALA